MGSKAEVRLIGRIALPTEWSRDHQGLALEGEPLEHPSILVNSNDRFSLSSHNKILYP